MNTFIKRVVCGFLAFLVLLVSVIIPDFSSFAESGFTVVIPDDDTTHYYVLNHYVTYYDVDAIWNEYTFLTVDNYVLNYDKLSGQEKNAVNNKFVDTTNDTGVQAIINDFLYPSYSVQTGYLNITQLYFLPVIYNNQTIPFEDCTHLIAYIRTGSAEYWAMYQFYCPTGKDIIMSGNSAYCEDVFYFTYQPFGYGPTIIDGIYHNTYAAGSPERLTSGLDSLHNIYYTTLNPSAYYGTILTDMQYLFTSNTLSGISTDYDSYNSYLNNVSYAIDRRPDKFKNAIDPDGGGNVSPSDYGFLDGSFDALIYGSSFDDQGFFVSYQLNDVSATIKDQLYLKLNYQFDLDGIFSNNEFDYSDDYYSLNGVYDMYSLQDSSYINVDLNSVFSKMNTVDRTTINQYQNIYHKFNPGNGGFVASPQTVNPLGAFDILYKNGLLTSAPIAYNIDNPLIQSLGGTYKGFNFQVGVNTSALYNESGVPEISRLDSCLITITISIYNVLTGEESATYLYSYDYKSKTAVESGSLENGGTFSGTYNDGSQASISNPNSSELGYNIANGSQYPVSSGSSSSSTGNYVIVQDSPYPYVLVDIPENEWIAKTPNLKTLLETYKDALATTKDESILPLIAQTYNYLPSEAMQYLIYGVGIIVMIGIWRAITRR